MTHPRQLFTLGLALTATLSLSWSVQGQDADEIAEEIARKSGLWVLEYSYDHPRWLSMNTDLGPDNEDDLYKKEGDGRKGEARDVETSKVPGEFQGGAELLRTENYWYVFYTLKNPSDTARRLFINVTAKSDDGTSYHDIYEPAAFLKLKGILQDRGKVGPDEKLCSQQDLSIPLEQASLSADPATRKLALPTIEAGQTLKCVAIFPKLSPEMDKLLIHFQGFSNDLIIENPEDHRRLVKERVLELEYKRLGNPDFTANQSPTFVAERWITVERTIKTDLRAP